MYLKPALLKKYLLSNSRNVRFSRNRNFTMKCFNGSTCMALHLRSPWLFICSLLGNEDLLSNDWKATQSEGTKYSIPCVLSPRLHVHVVIMHSKLNVLRIPLQDLITVKFTPIADRDHKTATIVKQVSTCTCTCISCKSKAQQHINITTCVYRSLTNFRR